MIGRIRFSPKIYVKIRLVFIKIKGGMVGRKEG